MQKKLLAVAVAGALLAPAAAMAQSSVTISGIFKVGIDNFRVGNRTGVNSNETRITDNSSRMIFGITEDLGGGLAGIAQLDARFTPDDAGGGFSESGNTWVGLRSSSLGTLTFGRHDLHYGKQPDSIAAKAGALMAASVSLMDYTAAGQSIANATRTPNVVRYDTPNFGGFAATVAYSTSPFGNESDTLSAARKGNAWNFNPSYTAGPIQVGFSVWRAKGDASAAGAAQDQDSWSLYGSYSLGAFKVGLGINQAEVETVTAATTTKIADRRNWTVPVSWTAGPHTVYAHYTRAGKDEAIDNAASALGLSTDTKARMMAVAYNYDLSKRTAVGVTFAKINNGDTSAYNFFTNYSTTALGSAGSAIAAGEDPRLVAFTVRHAF
jgi:predicted porin